MMDGETMIIKARYTNFGEKIARRIMINKHISLEEFEYKLRELFDIGYEKKMEIYYLDDENDRIAVTLENELEMALKSHKALTFEMVIKQKIIDSFQIYPKVEKGNAGDVMDILIEDRWLTVTNAIRDDTKAWGTHIYTADSDIVKALAHTEKLELTQLPPQYNVIATLRFLHGCIKYAGSTSQGVTTLSYGPYDLSYIIEGVRIVPRIDEKS